VRTPNDSPPLAAPDPWGCLVAVALLALALLLASCAGRPRDAHPDADGGRCGWTSPLPDGGRWYAPTWGASRLRARSLGMGRP
jgi:hypothetical protein